MYLYGAHYMFGMGVTYLYDRHVRIDIIALQFPKKVQLWLRILTFLFIFVPFVSADLFDRFAQSLGGLDVCIHRNTRRGGGSDGAGTAKPAG